MAYKPVKFVVTVSNEGQLRFEDEVIIKVPFYKEAKYKLSLKPRESKKFAVKIDEYLIPYRKYDVKAGVYKDDVKYAEGKLTVNKKEPEGFLEYFPERSNLYSKITKMWYDVTFGKNYFSIDRSMHGTDEYLEVKYYEGYIFLEAGFNYELYVEVIEQACFTYGGTYKCVSYPNKYSTAFVSLCGTQDDVWDYVYHDKSEPEVRIFVAGEKTYHTVMTGGNRGQYPVKDSFVMKLEQEENSTKYKWYLENFKRDCKSKVLTNVDYRKTEGEFDVLGQGVSGTTCDGRVVDVTNVIPIKVEWYCRVGRASDIDWSGWPYCRTRFYCKIKKVY